MKIAVIDHMGNFGGGSRFIKALLPAMKKCRPDVEFVFFGNQGSIRREGLKKQFRQVGIQVKQLKSTLLASTRIFGPDDISSGLRYIQSRFRNNLFFLPPFFSGRVDKEIEKAVSNFNLAFFPWPFLLKFPKMRCPSVAVFHDFNFRYFFSSFPPYYPWQLTQQVNEIPSWLENSTPIVSSYFMAEEFKKFYPEYAYKAKVVHLASMSNTTNITSNKMNRIKNDRKIRGKYILYPTNIHSHKNIGPLLTALAILRKMGNDISLVLTGPKTDLINGKACDIGLIKQEQDKDVFGMGYVSNDEMDSLIQRAEVVVSTSLYEAGNGPGLEAWASGVPVAMSNIPPFIEHLQVQKVKAELFDPRCPEDIAEKINKILSDPEKAKVEAMESQAAIKEYTWEKVAIRYLTIFEETIGGKSK